MVRTKSRLGEPPANECSQPGEDKHNRFATHQDWCACACGADLFSLPVWPGKNFQANKNRTGMGHNVLGGVNIDILRVNPLGFRWRRQRENNHNLDTSSEGAFDNYQEKQILIVKSYCGWVKRTPRVYLRRERP